MSTRRCDGLRRSQDYIAASLKPDGHGHEMLLYPIISGPRYQPSMISRPRSSWPGVKFPYKHAAFLRGRRIACGIQAAVFRPKNAPRHLGRGDEHAACTLKTRNLRDRRSRGGKRQEAHSAKSMPRPGPFSRGRCRINGTFRKGMPHKSPFEERGCRIKGTCRRGDAASWAQCYLITVVRIASVYHRA